ncbi:uncharacterized protein [Apostichopus japonicus]|uniref:uncharacterized protein n=1 Tax=Stichopus japonicus TaxID=307972 RepID=UPI003AB91762
MFPKLYLLCCLLAVVEWSVEAEIITVDLSQEVFDGWSVFIPVNRSKLQSRIDEITSEKSDVKFFLPSYNSCKDHVCEDQHVVVIAYGILSAVLRDESSLDPDCDVALDSDAFSFMFPFLSSEPDQPGQLSLFLSRYTSTEGVYFDPNVAITNKIQAERLVHNRNETHVSIDFQHGDFKLKMEGQISGGCHEPNDYNLQALEDYTQELSLSQTPPDFSVCDNLHECICDVDFCSVWDRYREELTEAGSNVCQYWTHASDAVNCEASFEILEISTELKEYIALDEDHTTIVAGEMQKGSFGIGLKFPCVNQGIC